MDQVPASITDNPGWVSVLIPVLIAAVVTTLLYPNTTEDIREYWEDQFEQANAGPLITFDTEPVVALEPKYGITPVTNETKQALRVALGEVVVVGDEINNEKKPMLVSDQIRQFWEREIVEQANKAPDIRNPPNAKKSSPPDPQQQQQVLPNGTIPSIPQQASAEELTSLVSSVAEAVKNTGKDFDALIAERKERAAADRSSQPRQRKRDLVRKTTKKLIMPWRKWENL